MTNHTTMDTEEVLLTTRDVTIKIALFPKD